MLAIGAALQWEVRPVLRALRQVRRLARAPVPIWQGNTATPSSHVLVYRSGIGPDRAAESTRTVLERFPISALINTGCCGALAPELSAGSVVVAESVFLVGGNEETCYSTEPSSTRRLIEAARSAGLMVETGRTLTSRTPFVTAVEKRLAWERVRALTVDMETALVASVAHQRGIPLSCARVVLDDAATDLPPMEGITNDDGVLRPVGLAVHLLKWPSAIPVLVTLARAVRVCETNLERLFVTLLSRTARPEA
jgi:adenosylhomocysteine nucleosidase